MSVLKEEKERVLVTCAFCGGKGVDPFGIMSRLSTCCVCKGEKAVWVEKPVKDCIFCKGTGVSPTGARNHCAVCGGAGVVHVEEPSVMCPNCEGSGVSPTSRLYCYVCKGTGVVLTEAAAREESKAKLLKKRDFYREKTERIDAALTKIEKAAEAEEKVEEDAKVEV